MEVGRITIARALAGVCAAAVLVTAAAFAGSAAGLPAPRAGATAASDPTDAPAGPEGKTDLRSLEWDVGSATTTQTISVDESHYKVNEQRTRLGLHVLLDTDRDGLADVEVVGARSSDGVSVDMTLRLLDRALSTSDCQDLAGKVILAQSAAATRIANGLETFSLSFDNSQVPGGLSHFRWVAFGQSRAEAASAGPWDYVPETANPDSAALNPGDQTCNAVRSGLRARMTAGIDAPDTPAFHQTTTDPSDVPSGSEGETDLRSLTWDVGDLTTTLTVTVDASTYGTEVRAALGIHVLIDADRDGFADAEVTGARNADGMSVDMALRVLDRTLSTADCQDLAGKVIFAQRAAATTIANGLETLSFTFDTNAIPGGLSHFSWAAFGQSPEDAASAGPWDYLPNAANPDVAAANPGDQRCNAVRSGLRLDMKAGIDFKGVKSKKKP